MKWHAALSFVYMCILQLQHNINKFLTKLFSVDLITEYQKF